MFLGMRIAKCLVAVAFCSAVASCAGPQTPVRPAWQEVKISDFKSVTGSWKGLTWMEPKTAREHNWAKVTIQNDGVFRFETYRTIGAWVGKGTLQIEDGKMVSPRSDQDGTIKITLFEAEGKRMLRVDATDQKGRLQRAELTPSPEQDRPDKS